MWAVRIQLSRIALSERHHAPRHVGLRSAAGLGWSRSQASRSLHYGSRPSIYRPLCVALGRVLTVRGKKTKTVVNLEDLPQGVIRTDLPPLPEEPPAAPTYPTVILQSLRNMRKFENCVLLTRVGGFYELYFEHAEEYGPLLNLKVAEKKTNAGPVAMVCLGVAHSYHDQANPAAKDWMLWWLYNGTMISFLTRHRTGRFPFLPARSIPQNPGPGSESICCHC